MKKSLKIAVVGNCQARPLARILSDLCPSITVTTIAIVHLLKDSDESDYSTHFDEADFIVAQLVSSDYPCKFVQNDELKKKYGCKVIAIVNLYYAGYHPDWCYVRLVDKSLLKGTYLEYQNLVVLSGWINNKSVSEVLQDLNDTYYMYENFGNAHEKSIKLLKDRECKVDVVISDFIEEKHLLDKLFHSYNHPCNATLIEYAIRILCNLLNVSQVDSSALKFKTELLGKISLPINIKESNRIFECNPGREITKEIVESEFALYERNRECIDNKKFRLPFNRLKLKKERIINGNIRPPCDHPRLGNAKLISPAQYIDNYTEVLVKVSRGLQIVSYGVSEAKAEVTMNKVLDLFTPGAVVYTHWLFDLVPKLKILENAKIDLNCFDHVVVNALNSKFQIATIERLGINKENIIPISRLNGKTIKCRQLVKVSPPRIGLSTEGWIIDYIKDFFALADNVVVDSFKKIYISRINSGRRKVTNEAEVQQYLLTKGFTVLECENRSIGEVIKIMSKAEIVVGPHGAGMSNIAFCRKGTQIIEFFSQHISKEYWLFSESLGFDYSCLPCADNIGKKYYEQELDYKNLFFEINAADITVNIDELSRELESKQKVAA